LKGSVKKSVKGGDGLSLLWGMEKLVGGGYTKKELIPTNGTTRSGKTLPKTEATLKNPAKSVKETRFVTRD